MGKNSKLLYNNIVEMFEDRVANFSDKIALIYDDIHISYDQLNKRANKIASYLQNRGVTKEDIVAIMLDNSPFLLEVILGILKIGAVYLPLDPSHPQKRLEYIINNSGAKLVISLEKFAPNISGLGYELLLIDKLAQEIFSNNDTNLGINIASDNAAYVIYTSGSTGEPKGVIIQHISLLNYLAHAREYNISMTLLHSSCMFDMSITSLFSPLVYGDVINIASRKLDQHYLENILKKDPRINLIKLTPSHLQNLVFTLSNQYFSRLRLSLVVGGEALVIDNISNILEPFSNHIIINEYGLLRITKACYGLLGATRKK